MREREGRSRRPPRGRHIDDDDGDDGRRGARDDRRERAARDATMRAGERARANAPDARARERGGQVSSEVRRFEPGERVSE